MVASRLSEDRESGALTESGWFGLLGQLSSNKMQYCIKSRLLPEYTDRLQDHDLKLD